MSIAYPPATLGAGGLSADYRLASTSLPRGRGLISEYRMTADPTLTPGDPDEIPDTEGLPPVRNDEVPDEPAEPKEIPHG